MASQGFIRANNNPVSFRSTLVLLPVQHLLFGCAALVLSPNPNLTVAQVKQIIRRTARNQFQRLQPEHQGKMGAGIVNAADAVTTALRAAICWL